MSLHSETADRPARLDAAAWFATVAGLCGSFVAVGLARFAYAPLIPPLIQAQWFSAADTVSLGAANFGGYLVGAILGRPLAAAFGNRLSLRLLMLLVSVAFIACAYPLSVVWFFAWRFASGLSGGAIMVLVATSILPHIPVARRGFVSGLIFLGLGLGIAASGTIIPLLLHWGLYQTWLGLGIVSLILTAVSWFGWPKTSPPIPAAAAEETTPAHATRGLRVLYAQYSLNALALVPTMILLVDYVARGLGRGSTVGALYWVLFGAAATIGPVICGMLGDRIGFRAGYRTSLLPHAAALVGLAMTSSPVVLIAATIVIGGFTPGVVPLVLGRIQELMPHHHGRQRAAWSTATTGFALFQALAGYAYAYLFSHSGENYALIFLCGGAAAVLALLADLVGSGRR